MRTSVLPVLRLLVWCVIAVALCVLAFGRGDAAPADALAPTGEVADPTVAVTTGDVVSRLELTGTVTADPAAAQRSTAAGTVKRLRVDVGDAVEVGTPLLDVEQVLEPVQQPVVTGPDGTPTQAPPKERTKTLAVAATAAGTLTSLAVLVGQDVAVGADVATVSPGTLTVVAPLTQSEQFRLLAPPASAQVQAQGGPAPFACSDLRTGVPPAGEEPAPPAFDPYTGQTAPVSTAQVTCRVPAGTTVFAGMSVDVTLELGSAGGVLLVPVTAVLGTVGTGRVWVVGEDGASAERPVELGLTDGTSVEVRSGLAAGDTVLQYAPAPPDDDPAAAGAGFGTVG